MALWCTRGCGRKLHRCKCLCPRYRALVSNHYLFLQSHVQTQPVTGRPKRGKQRCQRACSQVWRMAGPRLCHVALAGTCKALPEEDCLMSLHVILK